MTASEAFEPTAQSLGSGIRLEPFPIAEAGLLAKAFVEIDPWKRLGFKPGRLEHFFALQDASSARFAIRCDGVTAGFVCVDAKWLCGPYLHFLGVLPGYQNRGLGSAVIAWFVAQARAGNERNAWVCVSQFNDGARALYAKHGFNVATTFADLIQDGEAEILMRKQLFVASNTQTPTEK